MSAPPHDLEAERIVLGAMMLGRRAAAEVFEIVSVADFYLDAHRSIAAGVSKLLANQDAPTDPVAVWSIISSNGARDLEGGAAYLHVCFQAVDTLPGALYHAHTVAELSQRRILLESTTRAQEALHGGTTSGEVLERLRAELEITPIAERARPEIFVDWTEFWARDRREPEWLLDDVLARGRGHSIYATHKAGKSLLMLWAALEVVRAGNAVVYLDFEMTEDDLYERLEDMGVSPETDLSLMHYALLPSLAPLDTPEGASELLARVDSVRARTESHVACVIDTTSRATAGEENSADTIRAFYRYTGIGLKQRGVTWARLDHAGKDKAAGQRGTSAKGDDVDVVWRLDRTENGIELVREVSRMGWVPEKTVFARHEDPLRFVRIEEDWPAGTNETAQRLDALGIAADLSFKEAGKQLRAVGWTGKQAVVNAAQKWRRQRPEGAA